MNKAFKRLLFAMKMGEQIKATVTSRYLIYGEGETVTIRRVGEDLFEVTGYLVVDKSHSYVGDVYSITISSMFLIDNYVLARSEDEQFLTDLYK